MSHQLFVMERTPALNEKDQKRVAYLEDQCETAKSLELTAQVKSLEADINTLKRGGLVAAPPLSPDEITIWQAWLPTVYSDTSSIPHRLADYHFDRIPQPVLKLWETHKKSGLFERFEIWTPEANDPDPILVGVNGNARHLIARWGESDANLVSFDDIKRALVRRWYKNEQIGNEPWRESDARENRTFATCGITVVAVVILACVVGAPGVRFFSELWSISENVAVISSLALLAVIGIGMFVYVRHRLTKKCFAASTIMQTIARHDAAESKLTPDPA